MNNAFGSLSRLRTSGGEVGFYSLPTLDALGVGSLARLPFSVKVLLESLLRKCDGRIVTEQDVRALAKWGSASSEAGEIAFFPSRVLLQDFTGVPAVVDLAALRQASHRLGGDPARINPLIPVDLVIDHSVQVDCFGTSGSLICNAEKEFERNRERYQFLKWGQGAFRNFRVVPPATGICHQVNLEYLAQVVHVSQDGSERIAYPDSLVGTDSHTTMINGLGVVGWGVGGIEAEAVMLGQPIYLLPPAVVGMRLVGELPERATATDLVLTVTQLLRKHGVVDKFVEFFGPGVDGLELADRATLANMAPEYGATVGFFPVDGETLRYLRATGRSPELVDLVERYTKEQGLFRCSDGQDPNYTEVLTLDMGCVEPSLAGPKRPQDRVALCDVGSGFRKVSGRSRDKQQPAVVKSERLEDGAVVIASITSCTNTSNPSVMLAAGLLAKKAVEHGLSVKPWVKTSLAPGSLVVTRYLNQAGLTPYLEALRFHTVGYGCATCIGNSGPLPDLFAGEIRERDLMVASVLSGNRNFEGRIHPLTKANYLASPPLVVAYALAGTVDIDLTSEPLGQDPNGRPVFLNELWPSRTELRKSMESSVGPGLFEEEYARVFEGSDLWNLVEAPAGALYAWDADSTYIQEPPYFQDLAHMPPDPKPLRGARVLALLGDSVTTDHISPAGDIAALGPAGAFLRGHGVEAADFNSYGARRGNHEVMMRGTFANVRLRNLMVPGTEGGVTVHLPEGEVMSIFDAAMRYQREGVPLVLLAGKDYGMGSSRDWAAKGTQLLGVRAVIAESYERIHRSNLVGMGVLPLQFEDGQNAASLGLNGREIVDVEALGGELQPGQKIEVAARSEEGTVKRFSAVVRMNTPVEVSYYRNGGILQAVLRKMLGW